MKIDLSIKGMYKSMNVTDLAESEITVTTHRIGTPGKLICKLIKDDILDFHEGDQISLTVDEVPMFLGRIFKKSRTSDNIIETTAYDQLIYLKKNKETIAYKNLTAKQVIEIMAKRCGLQLGDIEETGHKLSRSEDIQTVMDIIYSALDRTLINTGKLFVLYDDFGKLTLKNSADMVERIVMGTKNSLLNYTYSTDIEKQTYNNIKLVSDNEKTGRRESYYEYDSNNIEKWGKLQLHEKIEDNLNEAQLVEKVQYTAKLFNRVNKELSIEEAYGDPKIRAGSSVYVEIEGLAEVSLNRVPMVIDECTHVISNNEHTMRLKLYGGNIPQ